jgi:hypothetical protein
MKTNRCALSTALLISSTVLAVWGIYGMVTFTDSTGSGYDDRFLIFDNGFYPFFWGSLLLFVGYLLRFRFRLYALGLVAISDLLILVWKQFALRKQQIDYNFLSELFLICIMLFVFVLLDGFVQQAYDFACRKVRLAKLWLRS